MVPRDSSCSVDSEGPNELPPETGRSSGGLPRSSADPALPTVVHCVSLGSSKGRVEELPDMERERGLTDSGGDGRALEEEEEEGLEARGEKRLLKKWRDREGDDTAASGTGSGQGRLNLFVALHPCHQRGQPRLIRLVDANNDADLGVCAAGGAEDTVATAGRRASDGRAKAAGFELSSPIIG
ncbi:hypothetical protein HK405_013597, partial [Cladochytrium tenue]